MIEAVETSYKGYRFRSRLEARWAVFFDAMGLDWRYEHEGLHTPYGAYLPDFVVFSKFNPGDYYFVEVKGTPAQITHNDVLRWEYIVSSSRRFLALLAGDITSEPDDKQTIYALLMSDGFYKLRYYKCTICHRICFSLQCECGASTIVSPDIIRAFTSARSARFEHGETPQPIREVIHTQWNTTSTPLMKGMRLLVRSRGDNPEPDLLYPHPFPVAHLNDHGQAMCRNGGLNIQMWREVKADVLMGNICKNCLRCAASRASK